MTESLLSPYWYRVAGLHPRLLSTVRISRQTFRGEQWYVLANPASGRQFRVNALGYRLVGRLDGRRSVEQIWDILVRELGNDALSQREVQSILSDLTAAGMLQSERSPDLGAVFEAGRRRRDAGGWWQNLFGFKVALVDPTPLLAHLQGLARLLLNGWLLAAWAVLAGSAALLAALHWPELRHYASLHLSSARGLLLLWLLYPPLKVVHELGHALAIRHWGGEVRELGVSVFFVIPVPYVDGSAASGFSSKYRRMAVSAMGVLVETTLAALALLVWLQVDDGWLREGAFAILVIGGMSTVLVNANPLMRYDGYHVLSDWLEIPGLATRADAWLRYLGERWLLGNRDLAAPPVTGQRLLLTVFGLLSLAYRLLLLGNMALWLAAKQLALGLAVAAWMLLRFALLPAWRLLRLAFVDPRTARIRLRAAASVGLLFAAATGFLVAYPLPQVTRAAGLVWLPEAARVRPAVDGFVEDVRVADGQWVEAGEILLVLANPELEMRRSQLTSRLAGERLAYQGALLNQPGTALALGEVLQALENELADCERKLDALVLRAPLAGRVGVGPAGDLAGRFFARGSVVANVLNPDQATVRVALPQSEVDLLRAPPRRIVVRSAEQPRVDLPARLAGQEPAASYALPAALLGDRAGGPFATDPADADGLRTLEPFFVVDLALPDSRLERIGSRAWVHIEHAPRPLLAQWLRRLRQLLVTPLDAPRPAGAGI